MAVASCIWVKKDIHGTPPSPRNSHAMTMVGSIGFLFGGSTCIGGGSTSVFSDDEESASFYNDLYMLQVGPSQLVWEKVPQGGDIPFKRDGASLCAVGSTLYLFGGKSELVADESLSGLYTFDTGTLCWERCTTQGPQPRTLHHSQAVVGKNIYVFGGIYKGNATNTMYMLNTATLTWTPLRTSGGKPSPRCDHSSCAVGDKIYVFGGCAGDNVWLNDLHIFDTATLTWTSPMIKGEAPPARGCHTFVSHHDKDIYVFGGSNDSNIENMSFNDLYKLSLGRLKWKHPLYSGIPPERRYSHTSFILHSHMYVIGGINEQREFNDVHILKLINPSDRQPVMKSVLEDFGVHNENVGYTPTRTPQPRYELSDPPAVTSPRSRLPQSLPSHESPDFGEARASAIKLIQDAFSILEDKFKQLEVERAALSTARQAFAKEKEEYKTTYGRQQKELRDMLENHKSQNEEWLRQRKQENDADRKNIAKEKAQLAEERARILAEQDSLSDKSRKLVSVMQQFKTV
ncbi:PREDICTED: actin-fragmin kinase-like isoform X1 [Branchiostoma belcheri]|uniref:Actin-fragmin kinase-like isoform X1 n=1 Tax=Branchiostoma belcheri TaxID=7741 RepID=A0A6P5AR16_BRABE|nr:PREDICTED: actin-fragmin kinase-like isoform X1 [Branchiostoma belcheri]